MKNLKILLLIATFAAGALFKTALDESGIEFVQRAYADVAGMDASDLRSDREFKRAVEYIVERCEIDGDEIDC